MKLIDALLLLLAPERYVVRATEHAISAEFQRNRQLREQFPNQNLPVQRRAEIETNVRSQVTVVRTSVLSSIGITLAAIVAGVLGGVALGSVVGAPSRFALYLLQGAGAAILLGATLSEVGRRIETWSRESLAEEINAFLFRWLYVTGTFLFVVSVAWDTT
ncbi:hypothetical protein [Ramlibacter sp.]|uniref:hypothetical protein n=1 Tax=Ramlibacter sp. TaxID=1917967 RepID=UPI002D62E188|nr:hypothetical protein [Ramlibacter sp.]HYD76036.1 hypothetical protein [Ramlibacter sp.]